MRLDVGERLQAHLRSGLDRLRAHVRQEEDVVEREIARIDLGLAIEHIETGIADVARSERCDERTVVDEIAARRIDENGAGLQMREGLAR